MIFITYFVVAAVVVVVVVGVADTVVEQVVVVVAGVACNILVSEAKLIDTAVVVQDVAVEVMRWMALLEGARA